MERHRNSGVSSFEIGADYITVRFSGFNRAYRYGYRKAGQNHVETLKRLSRSSSGLNSCINRYMKNFYD